MVRKSTERLYDNLRQDMISARKSFEDTQLEAMNAMAESIIENGNMTPYVDEFALAMHGLIGYRSRNEHYDDYMELRDYEKSEDTETYDAIEKSVGGVTAQVMMHEGYGRRMPRFAMIPERVAISQGTGIYYPLRFTVHKQGNHTYRGGISLPVVETSSYSPELKPGYIPVAGFSRRVDRMRPDKLKIDDSLQIKWCIGKRAIVGAAIQDYSTKLHEDIRFLELLDSSTDQLHKAGEQLTEDSWRNIWADEYHNFQGAWD